MFSSRRLSTSLNFSFLPGSRSSATSPSSASPPIIPPSNPEMPPHRPRQTSIHLLSSGSPASPTARLTDITRSPPPASSSSPPAAAAAAGPAPNTATSPSSPDGPDPSELTISFVPQPSLNSSHPSLNFTKITRTLSSPNAVLRIGRYSDPQRPARDDQADEADHSGLGDNIASGGESSGSAGVGGNSNNNNAGVGAAGGAGTAPPSAPDHPVFDPPVGFKSKVVSRRHCEIWYQDSEWYIKDVKSSSGTFVNHFRLSGPKAESNPHKIRNGDLIQLGIDYRGGQEELYRCVKMTVLIGKSAQPRVTKFNRSTLKNLTGTTGGSTELCSICLCKISPCQALFMAPCSHVWHYKCILRLLTGPTSPAFLCPNCRCLSSLDAEIEDYADQEEEDEDEQALIKEAVVQSLAEPSTSVNAGVGTCSPNTSSAHNPAGPDTFLARGAGPSSGVVAGDDSSVGRVVNTTLASQMADVSLDGDGVGSTSNGPSEPRHATGTALRSQAPTSGLDALPSGPFPPELQQTAVNPTPPTPKSRPDPATPRLNFLDPDTAAAAIMAVSGADFPSSLASSPFDTPPGIGANAGAGAGDSSGAADPTSVLTPPNTVGPYLHHSMRFSEPEPSSHAQVMMGRPGSPSPMSKQ